MEVILKNERKKMCNLIIIDASGSMNSKKSEVIGGLKLLFNDICKNGDIDQHTIVCDFSGPGDFNVLLNTSTLEGLTDATAETYTTRGMTALYDAIGRGFSLVPSGMDGVFVNILTDGEENSSKEFKAEKLKELIAEKKAAKWGITFLGTSEEALLSAQNLGISKGNMAMFDNSAAGIKKMSATRSRSYGAYTSSVQASFSVGDTESLVEDLDK